MDEADIHRIVRAAAIDGKRVGWLVPAIPDAIDAALFLQDWIETRGIWAGLCCWKSPTRIHLRIGDKRTSNHQPLAWRRYVGQIHFVPLRSSDVVLSRNPRVREVDRKKSTVRPQGCRDIIARCSYRGISPLFLDPRLRRDGYCVECAEVINGGQGVFVPRRLTAPIWRKSKPQVKATATGVLLDDIPGRAPDVEDRVFREKVFAEPKPWVPLQCETWRPVGTRGPQAGGWRPIFAWEDEYNPLAEPRRWL